MIAWPLARPLWPLVTSTGGPIDARVSFQPEVGPPITRRRFTARIEEWQMAVVIESRADLAVFEQWFDDETEAGALPFVWRHPVRRDVTRWKFTGEDSPYEKAFLSTDIVRVSFAAIMLPGIPWFAAYVPEYTVRLPAFVADYDAGVFGIGGETVPASEMPGIAGTFDVWTTDDQGVTVVAEGATVTAGDVPASAPGGVDRIVGFAP